jgi:uncharacterized membrane protein
MSYWKSCGLVLFAAVCLLGVAAGSARAQIATEWSGGSVINLGGLPGSTFSSALSINDVGQAVGASAFGGSEVATEWSGGSVINLGGLPGSTFSSALSINDVGQAVGASAFGGSEVATE